MTDTDKLEREGAVLGKVIYWIIIAVTAGIAAFGTAAAVQKKAYFGVPATAMILITVLLWAFVVFMIFRAVMPSVNKRVQS